MSVTCHIPEHLNPQQHYCENTVSHKQGTGLSQNIGSLKRGPFLEILTPTGSEHSYPLPFHNSDWSNTLQASYITDTFSAILWLKHALEPILYPEDGDSTFLGNTGTFHLHTVQTKKRPSFEQCSVWSDYKSPKLECTGLHVSLYKHQPLAICKFRQVDACVR